MRFHNIVLSRKPDNPDHKIDSYYKNSILACREGWYVLSSSLFLDTLALCLSRFHFKQCMSKLRIIPRISYDDIVSQLHMSCL
jgi:hypothetical protein